jgi:hypothetical protein
MKKLVLVLMSLVLAAAAFAADKAKTDKKDAGASKMTGYITDKSCASDKAKASNEACAKKCIERDGAAVFVNDKDGSITPVHNVDAIKGHEGHHVTVTGSMMGDSLHVDKVDMAKAGK